MTEGWQRQRFFEALARAVLNTRQPLLLVLDELQWCDRETLEWLHYLLRFEPHIPLLLVGTVRLEETLNGHPLTSWLVSLRRDRLLSEITLEPLDASETASLAEHVAGREFDSTLLTALYQETEGNPLFVVETVRAGALERNDPALPSGITVPLVPQASKLPPTVQAVISARLAQLSPLAREVVSVKAEPN